MVFTQWREKGLKTIGHLYMDGQLALFQQLQVKFNMPTHFFQIPPNQEFLKDTYPQYGIKPNNPTLDSLILVKPHSKESVSRLYDVLQAHLEVSTDC